MSDTGILLFGIATGVLACLSDVPQTVRSLRTRSAAGLSLTTTLMWTASWAIWLAYALSIRDWPVTAFNAVGLALQAAVLWVVVTSRLASGQTPAHLATRALALLPFAAVPALWALSGPAWAIGVLVALDVAALLPQLQATFASRDLDGLSAPSYWLRLAVYGLWIAYMAAVGDWLLAAYVYPLAPITAAILARILWVRRHPARS